MPRPVKAIDGPPPRYSETVLKFAMDPPISVDLRRSVPPPVRDSLRAIGLDGKFAVLTAYNPRGENIPKEENDARQTELENKLRSTDERFIRLDACSPDESHCECSIAVMTTRESAIDIARRLEQLAIFWFDGNWFWIVGVLADGDPVRLPAVG